MIEAVLTCETGSYTLARPGVSEKAPLQPWDAADSYLISQASQLPNGKSVAIVNDQFGALATALSKYNTTLISDSACAREATKINLEKNHIPSHNIQFFSTTEAWTWKHTPSIALVKLPRNLSFLQFELTRCWENGIKECWVAGMMKHLPKNLLAFLQNFGDVSRLPFVKKATIFKVTLKHAPKPEYPKAITIEGLKCLAHANVFGRDKIDPGAALFLQSLPHLGPKADVADLCCGTGILGLKYLEMHPSANVEFFDESLMAIESTKESAKLNGLKIGRAEAMDGLSNSNRQYDLILCNPPFHEQNTVGDHIAKRLFKQAKHALRNKGSFIMVGNRHLNYHVTLKKYFRHCRQLNTNAKFVVFECHD